MPPVAVLTPDPVPVQGKYFFFGDPDIDNSGPTRIAKVQTARPRRTRCVRRRMIEYDAAWFPARMRTVAVCDKRRDDGRVAHQCGRRLDRQQRR